MNDSIITTSWDDGNPLDFKLGKLLHSYGISGTFYIPCSIKKKPLMDKEEIKKLSQQFEIGGHNLNHSNLTLLSKDEMHNEISRGKEVLEDICGDLVSFAYPRGQYNNEVINAVKKAGFKGARTAEFLRYKIKNQFEYHPTVHAFNRILASRGKQSVTTNDKGLAFYLLKSRTIFKPWYEIAKKSLDFVLSRGGIWHLWGHSWEINENNDWKNLSNVLDYAKRKGNEYGADFLSNGEIFTNLSR